MALFLSDLHLGSRVCEAEALLEFLAANRHHEALYLVGDAVDDHRVARWPDSHAAALLAIARWPQVFYTPGNHDSWARAYLGAFPGVVVADELVVAAGGRRYLVTHGDRFDRSLWVVRALGPAARLARFLTPAIERLHTWWVGAADGAFVDRVTRHAAERGLDGVVCGHTHAPGMAEVNGVEYINCGDWVRSCTGVSEDDGEFTLLTGGRDMTRNLIRRPAVVVASILIAAVAINFANDLAAALVTAAAAQTPGTVTATPPASAISFGDLGAQILGWVAAAFSVPIGGLLTVLISRLMSKAGVEYTSQMSDELNKTIVNGLNAAAAQAGNLLQGQATVQVQNQIVASAVAYAQAHRAETIQALGLDPQSGAAVAVIKARIATLIVDPASPTPPALDPPKTTPAAAAPAR